MKYGICNEIFKDWKWEKTVRYVSSLGYSGIEIAPFTFADSVDRISADERNKIRETAAQNNLEIIGIHWLLVSPEGLQITSPDKKLRTKTAEYLRNLINFCADLGGGIMVLGSPKQRNISPSLTYKETYDYFRETCLEILPLAGERNVVVALEPLARTETNFINTAEEALRMIKEIGHPSFQLHLDVKAMSDEEKSIPEIIESAGKHLAHFHVNDPNLSGPGFGEVDYRPIKKALEKIDYTGYLSVEVFNFSPGAEIIAQKSLSYLKTIFEESS